MAGESLSIQQLRTDANTAWPNRDKSTDGTWGDTSHNARKSDHNTGDAIDITNDPNGADGDVIAAYAIRDPRVQYVIWNRRIYNRDKPGWRPYSLWEKYPHDHHVHVSIKLNEAARADTSPWAWLMPGPPPPISLPGETRFEDTDPLAPPANVPIPLPRPRPEHDPLPVDVPLPRPRPVTTSEADIIGPRYIYDGESSILLGTKQRMAAHVESPHTGGGQVAKGSDTVFVGTKQLAFARLGDPTTDNLNVKTGHEAILIG